MVVITYPGPARIYTGNKRRAVTWSIGIYSRKSSDAGSLCTLGAGFRSGSNAAGAGTDAGAGQSGRGTLPTGAGGRPGQPPPGPDGAYRVGLGHRHAVRFPRGYPASDLDAQHADLAGPAVR